MYVRHEGGREVPGLNVTGATAKQLLWNENARRMHDIHDPLTHKRENLRRHRRVATALLALAAAMFGATYFVPEPGFWVRLVRAGAEAGVIGGLADWFAVTALFRRPLGLPIPHTAIIPRNKDRIGQGLGAFVQRNFLAPELITQKLRSGNAALRVSRWLALPHNSRLIAEQLVGVLPDLINSAQDQEVRAFFRDAFRDQLKHFDLVPLLVRVLRLLEESRQHQRLFERTLLLARNLLKRNEQMIYERVENHTSWWVPRQVDEKVARKIIEGTEELLLELTQPEHPARREFDVAVHDMMQKLETSPAFRARVEEIKAQVLSSPELATALESLWDEVRTMLLSQVSTPSSGLTDSLAASLQALARTLEQEPEAQARLNRRIEHFLVGFVVPFRAEIGAFIAEVVESWDADTVTEQLELEVGRDLQYIRINGTLVGALAGCVLFLITQAAFH